MLGTMPRAKQASLPWTPYVFIELSCSCPASDLFTLAYSCPVLSTADPWDHSYNARNAGQFSMVPPDMEKE